MFIVCIHLLPFFIHYPSNTPLTVGHNNHLSLLFVFYTIPAFFGSGYVAPAFQNNNMNKGRWTQDEQKIFMQEYEKYGNNCMQIAWVLSTQTPAQIKKHAECFFKQNLKTSSAAVKQYQESLSPNKKAQGLVINAAEQQNYQQSLSP